ncbi:hypothetical protein PoB_000678600 [Plakobranchus ocellatus]|uniref:Uncharacterized protein n=1 Tax=Plakobranchus ocellatus TaxID=259542 RepID=A0AAV3YAS0_9GAST|nr:hypothetical protein PoB_000678600 [Plakobranchus ocellatus]
MQASTNTDPTMETTASVSIPNPERLAVKTIYAADILKNIVESAKRLSKIDKVLNRYLKQARLLLVWKRGSGAIKMAGSAAKAVGALVLTAAPLHPKIAMGCRVAHKLWKIGTGLKILNALANMIRDVWQKGCRSVLLDFTRCAATLTRNLGVFGEVLRDLQSVSEMPAGIGQNGPRLVIDAIRGFIPPHQIPYATHVINMVYGNERYSPLFAFTAMTLNSQNNSNIAQVMLEIESFHFDDFIERSESRTLVAIGSFLHVSRELFDFLDGFQHLTELDCQFLQDCLKRLTQESLGIMKAVAVLVNLDKIRKQINAEAPVNSVSSEAAEGNTHTPSLYESLNRSAGPSAEEAVPAELSCTQAKFVNQEVKPVIPLSCDSGTGALSWLTSVESKNPAQQCICLEGEDVQPSSLSFEISNQQPLCREISPVLVSGNQ